MHSPIFVKQGPFFFFYIMVRMIWYYIDESITDGDRRKGPYSLEEIKDFVKEGKIVENTLVWHSGMERFILWKDMEESREGSPEAEDELIKQTIEAILAQQKQQKRYAGFLIRGVAFVIDNVILTAICFVILQIVNVLQLVDMSAVNEAMTAISESSAAGMEGMSAIVDKIMEDSNLRILFIASSIVQALYFIVFTAIKSATPGKMLLHLHVETAEGEKVGWITSITRYIASLITQFTLVLYGFGYLIVMVDPKRRALHDHIARSRVVINNRIKVKVRPNSEQEK